MGCDKEISICCADSYNNTFDREMSGVKYACDFEAASIGNMLVENTEDALCLEISSNAKLMFEGDCVIAITGASGNVRIADETLPRRCAAQIDAGDILEICEISGGYLYIAVNGTLEEGKSSLISGDEIELSDNNENLYNMDLRCLPETVFDGSAPLRLIPGPYAEDFKTHALELLYTTEFTVKKANRENVVFHGVEIERAKKLDEITYAPVGALFIGDEGDPYIIMQDSCDLTQHKCMAVVISSDMPHLAMLAPGDKIRFSPCTVEAAQKLLVAKRKEYINSYLLMNSYEQ